MKTILCIINMYVNKTLHLQLVRNTCEVENTQFFVLPKPFYGTKYRLTLEHLPSHFSDLGYCRNEKCTQVEQRPSIVYNI